MSWHFSQALVAEFSAATCSDGGPSAPWNSMPSAPDDSCSARMKATCHRSPSGTMFVPLTDARGAALLTWFRQASRVRTSASSGTVPASTESRADSVRPPASFARLDPGTCCWRTPQRSLLGASDECSVIWPAWGSMLGGECWEHTTPASITGASESGLLPTPLAADWKGGTAACRSDNGRQRLDQWRHYVRTQFGLTYPHPTHSEIRMGWPSGWTDCAPLATARFQEWRRLHGRC